MPDLLTRLRQLEREGETVLNLSKLLPAQREHHLPHYFSWRTKAVAAVRELGRWGKEAVKGLEEDPERGNFLPSSTSRILGTLTGAVDIARDRMQRFPEKTSAKPTMKTPHATKKVFLVHGHDVTLLQSVARFLEKLQLEVVILAEQPGGGKTLIEKLEANQDVRFAVVLLTADDLGRAKNATDLNPRARQNVVLELGYFVAHLGRANVAPLYESGVELPSDYTGVEYIKIDSAGAWKMKLVQELRAAKLDVDMNKAL